MLMPAHRVGPLSLLAFAALAALVLAGVAISSLVYGPEYTRRVLLYRGADVRDYVIFPERPLIASPQPFTWPKKLDEDRVRAAFEAVFNVADFDAFLSQTGTQAFIVIVDDAVVYEQYLNGARRDSVVTSFSVAKSFVSALVGIAIADGFVASVDDQITSYLPELEARDRRFADITIRNLLRMSSGIKYVETGFIHGDDALTYYYPDMRRLALEWTTIVGQPGEAFLYNNYHPLLLGVILERATGQSVTEYLQQRLWTPLGMEFGGSWSLDSDASAFEKMESGLNARAIDFARFGRLYLQEGMWNGQQLVPAAWTRESTSPDPATRADPSYPASDFYAANQGYYKYFWWGRARAGGDYDFWAMGNHGQFVYVSPRSNLVIVRNGERYGVPWQDWTDAFYRFAEALQ